MFIDALKQLKWVDIFLLILLFRICYVSIKTGIAVEAFKLLGTITATFISLHYYTIITDFLATRLPIEAIPLEFLDFLMFIVIAVFCYLIFVVLRITFLKAVKVETISLINRWGGLIFGVTRGILLVGLATYLFAISSVVYFKNSAKSSYFGNTTIEIAPAVYTGIYNGIISKFLPQEKFNKNIEEVINSLK